MLLRRTTTVAVTEVIEIVEIDITEIDITEVDYVDVEEGHECTDECREQHKEGFFHKIAHALKLDN